MKKFVTLLLFISSLLLTAQDESTNLQKYWHYRYRLIHNFMVVGENPGMSLPADIRNTGNGGQIRWGEVPVYLGYYIGVLATEYRLLKNNNQPTDQTLTELYYAIKAALRLDRAGETYPYWNSTHAASINGFFIRDDVPSDFLYYHSELNFDATPSPVYITSGQGTPGYVNSMTSDWVSYPLSDHPKANAVSQDVMYELLMGFALVKKYVEDMPLLFIDNVALHHPDYVFDASLTKTVNFNQMARTEADIIVSYMKYNHFDHWKLNDPDGNQVFIGSAVFTYAYAIARAGNYITGVDYTDSHEESYELLWQGLQNPAELLCPYVGERGNAHPMALTLAAISNAWRDHPGANANNTTPDQILANGDYNANPASSCPYIASHIGWDVFYGALWDVFHGGPTYISDLCKAKEILNSAPFNGPYYHTTTDNASPGWCATRRFYDGVIGNDQRADVGKEDFNGNFNGLDYMLLFNLYYLDAKERELASANAATFYIPQNGFADQYPWTHIDLYPPYNSF
ncbi:MAG: hypothetical protein ABIQ40_05355 [Bacteroidia bacterium]